jgi:hypothetical protein
MPFNTFVEVVYDYNEFVKLLNPTAPKHHNCTLRNVDKLGVMEEMTFKIFGIKNNNNPIIFEFIQIYDRWTDDKRQVYDDLVKQYADPLKSTEGRWEY